MKESINKTCPTCGGLPGIYPNNQCPTCYVKGALTTPTEHETIDTILMGVWHSGYNRHVLEVDPKDHGFDRYSYSLTDNEAKQAFATLIAREIIGEDEATTDTFMGITTTAKGWFTRIKPQNELRAKMRESLTALLERKQ